MSFYYHFNDIYDLVEWACVEDGKRVLKDKKSYDTWQEGLMQVFEAVKENKPFIMNVYSSLSRERLERFLHKLTYHLIAGVVEEKSEGISLSEKNKEFIAQFYQYAFVGIMLDWIDRGMKDDYKEIVEKISITLHGNIPNSIHNFEKEESKI
jgi:hypothetical protein